MVEGSCEFFMVTPFLAAADILVAADEPLRALEVLKSVPAYYRDHQHPEILEKTNRIYARLATPAFYAHNIHDQGSITPSHAAACMDYMLRGQLIRKDVEELNAEGKTPHIFDLGPGEYWLPLALHHKGLKFSYQDVGLNPVARKKAMDQIGSTTSIEKKGPAIFVACELIEHLHHEEDIRVEYERHNVAADIVHISTPKYTWDGNMNRLHWDRDGGDLGHLRTYTPREFISVVGGMFPEFEFQFFDSKVMHLRGTKRG